MKANPTKDSALLCVLLEWGVSQWQAQLWGVASLTVAAVVAATALGPCGVVAQRRATRRLDRAGLERLVRPAVEASLAPCEVTELDMPRSLVLPAGVPSASSLGVAPRASGRVTAPVIVTVGAQDTRVLVSARVVCPAPLVLPGARVRIVVIVGAVRASAPGVVLQPGRVGDQVRVTNVETRAQLSGRVVDGGTVEVRP